MTSADKKVSFYLTHTMHCKPKTGSTYISFPVCGDPRPAAEQHGTFDPDLYDWFEASGDWCGDCRLDGVKNRNGSYVTALENPIPVYEGEEPEPYKPEPAPRGKSEPFVRPAPASREFLAKVAKANRALSSTDARLTETALGEFRYYVRDTAYSLNEFTTAPFETLTVNQLVEFGRKADRIGFDE